MRVYVVEYRWYNKGTNEWGCKISQEGYKTLEEAQAFILGKPGRPAQITPLYYQTELLEEYYVLDILVR